MMRPKSWRLVQTFLNGSGVEQPNGFLTYGTAATADATRSFGTLQYVATGNAGAFAASNPADKLIELLHTLAPPIGKTPRG